MLIDKVEFCCFSLYDMFCSNKVTLYFHYLAQWLVSLKADFCDKAMRAIKTFFV